MTSSTFDVSYSVYRSLHTVCQPSWLAVWKQYGLEVKERLQRVIVFVMTTVSLSFLSQLFSVKKMMAQPRCLAFRYWKDKEWRNEQGKSHLLDGYVCCYPFAPTVEDWEIIFLSISCFSAVQTTRTVLLGIWARTTHPFCSLFACFYSSSGGI